MTESTARLTAALAGRYTVERELGAGGMATVYLAHDARHNRKVAVKVLREYLSASIGAAARFQREIAIAAQLQHPHILPLHDSGDVRIEGETCVFFVMPYVDGQSLRARLQREGALPIAEAIRIVLEIVDALSYAHAHGIVHRDIKPDNVMLSGRHALVTDFGVAKAVSEATGAGKVTTAGVALGTPAYMAPEQVTADPHVDHRADLYAVGVLAYELLTGSPPFTGGSAQQVLAAQVTATPAPVRTLRPEVPPALERVVMRCLAKDPAERWQSATDLLAALEPLATPSGAAAPASAADVSEVGPSVPARRSRAGLAAIVGALALVMAAAAGAAWWFRRPPPLPVFGRTAQLTSEPGLEIFPAIAPDGRVVAYAAGNSARMRIYLRDVRGGRTIPLSTDTAAVESQPRWSPDGGQILYLSRGGVWAASSLGGGAREVVFPSASSEVVSAAWLRTGDSVAVVRGDSLLVYALDGGAGRFVTTGIEWHSCASSPMRDEVACVAGNRDYVLLGQNFANLSPSAIVVVSLATGRVVSVTDSISVNLSPQWSTDGRQVFFVSNRDGQRDVYAVAVTSDGHPRGAPARVTTGLGAQSIAFDREEKQLVYAVYREEGNLWSLPIPSREGAPVTTAGATQLTSGSQVIESMSVSRDGRWVYYDSNIAGTPDVYRMAVDGGTPERLTDDPSLDFYPVPSPDGKAFAFHSPRGGTRDLYVQRVGDRRAQRLTATPMQECCGVWSPDGRRLAYTDYLGEQGIFMMRRDSAGRWSAPEHRLDRGFQWDWSHDGALLAVASGRRLRSSLPSESIEVISPDSGAPRLLYTVTDTLRDPIVGKIEFAGDGAGLYFKSHDAMGRASFWYLPLAGGRPRLLVRFDDFARPSFRSNFAVGAGRFFFAVNDRQSDVWVAELSPQ